jgi:hypothetical protein
LTGPDPGGTVLTRSTALHNHKPPVEVEGRASSIREIIENPGEIRAKNPPEPSGRGIRAERMKPKNQAGYPPGTAYHQSQ